MTIFGFLRTLDIKIHKANENIEKRHENFIDSRYSSPLTNPFLNRKPKTIVWIEKE